MGLLTSLKTLFYRDATKTDAPEASPRTGAIPLFVTEPSGALNVATVFRCVDLLSRSVANLPLRHLKLRGGIFAPSGDNAMDYLLNVMPSPEVNAFEFRRRAVWDILTRGNAYIVPFRNPLTGALERLALCGAGTVAHNTLTDTYTVSDHVNGIYGSFDASEIIHLKMLTGADGKTGLSVLSYARMATAIASAGDRETRQRIESGGDIKGILSNGGGARGFGEHADAQLNKLATDIDSRFKSGENIVSLPGEVGWVQLSMSSADMQFLESRKFTVREICRFFGVHPSFVFDDTSNNYKSAEQANAAFLAHTLSPLLRSIEVEMLCKLFAPNVAHRNRIEFDRSALLTADAASLLAYRNGLLQTGTTVNEVRRMDNLPPVAGGDTAMVSANLRTITEVAAQGAPTPSLPQEPTPPTDNGEEE